MSAAVTKHGTIAALVFLALFPASFHASAQTCGMTMPTRTMDCSADCCAKTKSCILAPQNPVQPSATATALQSSFVMIAPVLHAVLAPIFDAPRRSTQFLIAQGLAHSPPPLALFCTLLI
ncbi:MAG: hypothetical protein H0X34_02405 [Chthoniobacterales bacterium]|jgi:hypothetical protein|nr:hypothetical protein [Chthoniobacterales bacterium]